MNAEKSEMYFFRCFRACKQTHCKSLINCISTESWEILRSTQKCYFSSGQGEQPPLILESILIVLWSSQGRFAKPLMEGRITNEDPPAHGQDPPSCSTHRPTCRRSRSWPRLHAQAVHSSLLPPARRTDNNPVFKSNWSNLWIHDDLLGRFSSLIEILRLLWISFLAPAFSRPAR